MRGTINNATRRRSAISAIARGPLPGHAVNNRGGGGGGGGDGGRGVSDGAATVRRSPDDVDVTGRICDQLGLVDVRNTSIRLAVRYGSICRSAAARAAGAVDRKARPSRFTLQRLSETVSTSRDITTCWLPYNVM